MLPASLLKFQIRENKISPVTLTYKWLPEAEHIIKIFKEHTGKKKKEISQKLEEYEYRFQKYQAIRGLCKISERWLDVTPASEGNPEETRCVVFEAAARLRPITLTKKSLLARTPYDVYAQVSGRTGTPEEQLKETLYADMEPNHILQSVKKSFTAKKLIDRYNLAQHQGLLYFASRLDVSFQGHLRLVWTHLKLSRLMYYLKASGGGRYHLTINGPVSLLRFSQKYGVNMARFLPALAHCSKWKAKAQLVYNGQKLYYEVSEKNRLVSHYKKISSFDSQLERKFFHSFRKLKSDWSIIREGGIIDLKGNAAIPDFKFTHKKSREIIYLEIVGFWTPEYIAHKTKLYRRVFQETKEKVILAVSTNRNCMDKEFEENVILFKEVLNAKVVLERLYS